MHLMAAAARDDEPPRRAERHEVFLQLDPGGGLGRALRGARVDVASAPDHGDGYRERRPATRPRGPHLLDRLAERGHLPVGRAVGLAHPTERGDLAADVRREALRRLVLRDHELPGARHHRPTARRLEPRELLLVGAVEEHERRDVGTALDEQPGDEATERVRHQQQRAVDVTGLEQVLELAGESPRVTRDERGVAPRVARPVVGADAHARGERVGDRRPLERVAAEPALEHDRGRDRAVVDRAVTAAAPTVQVQSGRPDRDELPRSLVDEPERQRLLGGGRSGGRHGHQAEARRDRTRAATPCRDEPSTPGATGARRVDGGLGANRRRRRGRTPPAHPHAPGNRYAISRSVSLRSSSSSTGRSHSARIERSR